MNKLYVAITGSDNKTLQTNKNPYGQITKQ